MLNSFLEESHYSQVFVLADDHTAAACVPRLGNKLPAPVVIPHGEAHKTLASCTHIWEALTAAHADRRSVLINVGGGLIGDLGGFAASCYKRGMDFIQVPTSLLSMVDASVGGKTGVNFDQYKNQVGAFSNPAAVFICPPFLETLPPREVVSGYAEVLKHCLIADQPRWEMLSATADLDQIEWASLIADSVQVKLKIVAEDPFEKGPRKALNFGHTVGHALESFFMYKGAESLLHGEAVLLGMLCESWISWRRDLISETEWKSIAAYLGSLVNASALTRPDRLRIGHLATQDKKNVGKRILCTLLDGIGGFRIDQEISTADILDSLNIVFPLTP
ncbi:UNVERIFIED_CONTAM: hypothetical protein GTU68_057254 [Idotea baltica]|nr:hypothetical protein [Idotea baltica]